MGMRRVYVWAFSCMLISAALGCRCEVQTESSDVKRNYYEFLGVLQTATEKDIKKAFHKLAAKYHPDKNKRPDAEKNFREIAEAYGVLSNIQKRKLYDEMGHDVYLANDPEAGQTEQTDFFSFSFNDLFFNFDLEDDPFEQFNYFMEQPHSKWSAHIQDDDDDDDEADSYVLHGNGFYDHSQEAYDYEEQSQCFH